MAVLPKLASTAAAAGAEAITQLCSSGSLKIYSGTQPATPMTAFTTAEVLLASLAFGATGFPASSSGIQTTTALTDDTSADATGTAAWFRFYGPTTASAVFDGSIGVTTDFNLVLNSVAISSGATVSVSSFTFELPRSS